MKSDLDLDWREVLDCKRPGTFIGDHIKTAKELNYRLACHNDRIYQVSDGEELGVVEKPGGPATRGT